MDQLTALDREIERTQARLCDLDDVRAALRGNFRDRLFAERNQLNERIEKLRAFIVGDKFADLPEIDRSDLREQLTYMAEYSKVLERRVARLCNAASF